jgi:hypothetical protein
MKKIFGVLALLMVFAAYAPAQSPYPYAAIVWSQPKSPTTNNVLTPTTFNLRAALYQGVRRWSHGFTDSTDYGREVMFWADLGTNFNTNVPWQVVYTVDAFLAQDPLSGEFWVIYSDFTTLHHGPGAGGVSGRITWRYFH